jgi:hypothetical protein
VPKNEPIFSTENSLRRAQRIHSVSKLSTYPSAYGYYCSFLFTPDLDHYRTPEDFYFPLRSFWILRGGMCHQTQERKTHAYSC